MEEIGGMFPLVSSYHFTVEAPDEKKVSFAQSLAALAKQREFTVEEIAERVGRVKRTVSFWMSGKVTPAESVQQHVIAMLSSPTADPSRRVRDRAERSHHLIWDKQKGWEVKVTFDLGPKLKGKRIRERLKTRDLAEAIARKDILTANWRRLGLKLADRRQRRRRKKIT